MQIRPRPSDERGQTMAEYAVVLSVIVLTLLAAFGLLSGEIEAGINYAASLIPK